MLTVGLIRTKPTLRGDYLLECFRKGIERHGDRCIDIDGPGHLDRLKLIDLGVQVCFANRWHANGESGLLRLEVQTRLQKRGKRILIIDTGFLRSQPDYEVRWTEAPSRLPRLNLDDRSTYAATDPYIYYDVGYDGIKGLADHGADDAPGDRWAELHCPLKPWRTKGKHIVIAGQPLHGQSSQHADIYRWYAETFRTLQAATRRPLLIRQHPRFFKAGSIPSKRSKADRDRIAAAIPKGLRWTWSVARALAHDLKHAWAAVTFSSNAGVAAAIAGVPVFAGSAACMAWPVANQDLSRIEDPKMPGRERWANELAYSQWNPLEMRNGVCWARLRPLAKLPPRTTELSP